MNFEESNLKEAKMLLIWWSKEALVAPGTMHDVLSSLAKGNARGKMNAFVEGCIRRRKVVEERG